MKTLTKKCVIVTAMAVLLVLTAMLTGCSNGIAEKEGYKPPAGMGAVKLNFNKNIARTILPDTATIADFDKFDLQFTPTTDGGSISPIIYTDSDDLSTPIDLVPGIYTLDVLAYIEDDTSTMRLAASATEEDIEITSGVTNSSVTIHLRAIDPEKATSNEEGTFAWDITPPADGTINSATLTLTAIGTGTTQPSPIILVSNWNNSVSIPVGYYYADFRISYNGIPITFRHIVHVYQGMTSTFTYEFEAGFFVLLKGTLTPSVDYVGPDDKSPELVYNDGTDHAINNGDRITLSSGGGDSIVITVTNDADYSAVNWYCQGTIPQAVDTPTFSVDTATGLFSNKGSYQIIVEGVTDGKHYCTYVVIKVID